MCLQAMAGRSVKELVEELENILSAKGERLSDYRETRKDDWPELFDEFGMKLGKSEKAKLTTKVIDVLKEGLTPLPSTAAEASGAWLLSLTPLALCPVCEQQQQQRP